MNLTKNNTLTRKNTKLSELLGGSFFGIPTEVRKKKLDLSKAAADIIDYVFEVFCRQSKNSAVFLLKNLQDEVKYSDNHLRKALRDINKSGALIVHDAGNKNFLIMVNNKGNLDYLDQVLRGEIIFENIKKPKSILSTIKDFFTLSSEQTEISSDQIEISSEQTEIFSEQIEISSELSTITQNTDNKELQPLQKSCIDLNTIDHIYIDHHHIDKKNDDAFFQKESNEEEEAEENSEALIDTDLEESDFVLEKEEISEPAADPKLLELFLDASYNGQNIRFNRQTALRLIQTYDNDMIKKELAKLPFQKINSNPAGFLKSVIEAGGSAEIPGQKIITPEQQKTNELAMKVYSFLGYDLKTSSDRRIVSLELNNWLSQKAYKYTKEQITNIFKNILSEVDLSFFTPTARQNILSYVG